MDEYINREALMRRIKEIHCAECDSYHGVRCKACWVYDTLDYIDSEPAADVEKMSDGYHTFADLYEQRLILSAALAKNNPHAQYKPNYTTNADRIRAMSDEELKKFICSCSKCEFCKFIGWAGCKLSKWLQQPLEV